MKAKRILKKLNYLPRWAWYLASLSIGGPIGPLFVYLGFHALDKMAKDQEEEESFGWDVDIDDRGVHVRGRSARAQGSASSVYQDEECTVTSDEDILTQWERAPQSGDAQADALIAQARAQLAQIEQADAAIAEAELSAQIDDIVNTCRLILARLEEQPQMLSSLRTFLRYYLPATLSLLESRSKLENEVNAGQSQAIAGRIREAMAQVQTAFHRQLDALEAYRFINLESEMDVLADMLRSDGLIEAEQPANQQEMPQEEKEEPFAGLFSK